MNNSFIKYVKQFHIICLDKRNFHPRVFFIFYPAIRVNSKGRSKGGIAICISTSLIVEVEEFSVFSQYFQTVHLCNLSLISINVYIPPKGLLDGDSNIWALLDSCWRKLWKNAVAYSSALTCPSQLGRGTSANERTEGGAEGGGGRLSGCVGNLLGLVSWGESLVGGR